MNQVLITYAVTVLLAWPLGRYIGGVYGERTHWSNRVFGPAESVLYRACGIDPLAPMDWRAYAKAMLKLHVILALVGLTVLMCQGWLPLNPGHVPNLRWDTALHTVVSFLTNTNQQHYVGQTQLSYLAQTLLIVTLQFVAPATGLAVLIAIIRGLTGRNHQQLPDGGVSLGNFYQDLVRASVRILLPMAAVVALVIGAQGVPATYRGAATIHTVAGQAIQRIPRGPVAPMVAIKQIGTNGGGWYSANSAAPLENPTPLSNEVETVSLLLIPVALVYAFGFMTRRKRLATTIMGVMLTLSVLSAGLMIWSELQPNAALHGLAAIGPNMEGKEVRIGPAMSALWGAWTTQTSNGSVNAMLDSFNPLGSLTLLCDMLINAIFGGIGVGLINYLLFVMLAAFIGSLMIGRSPELFGKPLETREMKLVSMALLLQPLLILGFSAAAVALGHVRTTNPGFQGFTAALYEYSSAFANNGSGFAGLHNTTLWWNLTCAVVMMLGRFIPMIAPLAVAGLLAAKRQAPTGRGSLVIDSLPFAVLTLGVIAMVVLLSFVPVLVFGPIAQTLTAH